MKTFVLLLVLFGSREPAMVTVPGYLSIEDCRAAGREFGDEESGRGHQYRHFKCITGPSR